MSTAECVPVQKQIDEVWSMTLKKDCMYITLSSLFFYWP